LRSEFAEHATEKISFGNGGFGTAEVHHDDAGALVLPRLACERG
jgi:hypothetical protein